MSWRTPLTTSPFRLSGGGSPRGLTTPASAANAVLVTGAYGAGKVSVVADNGAVLQWRGERCGLLAVEWLGWFDAGGDAALHDRLHGNVRSVSVAHLEQGVRRLALARSIENQQQLDAIRDAVPTPIHVVRLQVTAAQVEQRVSAAPTEEGRLDYLRVSMEWLSADFLLPGNRPIRGNK